MLEISFLTAPLCPGQEIFRDFDDHLCLKFAFCSILLSETRDFFDILMTIYAWNSLFCRTPLSGTRDFDDHLCLKLAFYSTPLSGTRDFLEILMIIYASNSVFAVPICPRLENFFRDFDDHLCLKLTFCRTPLSGTHISTEDMNSRQDRKSVV